MILHGPLSLAREALFLVRPHPPRVLFTGRLPSRNLLSPPRPFVLFEPSSDVSWTIVYVSVPTAVLLSGPDPCAGRIAIPSPNSPSVALDGGLGKINMSLT